MNVGGAFLKWVACHPHRSSISSSRALQRLIVCMYDVFVFLLDLAILWLSSLQCCSHVNIHTTERGIKPFFIADQIHNHIKSRQCVEGTVITLCYCCRFIRFLDPCYETACYLERNQRQTWRRVHGGGWGGGWIRNCSNQKHLPEWLSPLLSNFLNSLYISRKLLVQLHWNLLWKMSFTYNEWYTIILNHLGAIIVDLCSDLYTAPVLQPGVVLHDSCSHQC